MLSLGALLVGGVHLAPARLGLVLGDSMTPTLQPGQPFVYVPRGADGSPLQRGQIVLVRMGRQVCVKRLLALEGDRFWAIGPRSEPGAQCKLLAVGAPVDPWRRRYPTLRFTPLRVPASHVYVVGDGVRSVDSRTLGPVPAADVLGRVVLPAATVTVAESAQVAWNEPPPKPHRG